MKNVYDLGGPQDLDYRVKERASELYNQKKKGARTKQAQRRAFFNARDEAIRETGITDEFLVDA